MIKIYFLFGFIFCLKMLAAQTYYKDVAPIIAQKCATCHRPGETAPFNLLTYEDVAKRATFIKNVIQSRIMPPWKADNNYVHFANDRSLSDAEIEIISAWVDKKAPKGRGKDNVDLLKKTSYPRLPDVTLIVKDTFVQRGDNKEQFAIFKIPFEIGNMESVEAIEFISSNKRVIHHANFEFHEVSDFGIDIHAEPSFIDLNEKGGDGFRQFKSKHMVYYGGWIPGAGYEYYPKGIGWNMPKRGVLLLTVHYAPSSKEEKSVSGVNVFFSKKAIDRKVKVISFGSGGIGEHEIKPYFFAIKPNQISTYSLVLSNPGEDFSIMSIWPHMHYIGKSFKAFVETATHDTIPLVNIPDWDFRWQELYKFKQLVKVPKGSKIHMECSYDNTEKNPFNPFNPPRTIYSYGNMQSTQEMMTMMMIFLPYKEKDEEFNIYQE